MNKEMTPLSQIMLAAKQKSELRRQREKMQELVSLIDELSGEMGPAAFRDAIRKHGYDVDACTMTLERRGVNIN